MMEKTGKWCEAEDFDDICETYLFKANINATGYHNDSDIKSRSKMANITDPDQTACLGAVSSGYLLSEIQCS